MEFTPTKIVAPAKPGQVKMLGRLFATGAPDPDYVEAAALAVESPRTPIIVHEWPLPADDDADDNGEKALAKHVAQECATQRRLLNEADAAESLPEGVRTPPPVEGIERWAVSSDLHRADGVYRSVLAYFPSGRPIRQRKATDPPPADEPNEADGLLGDGAGA